MKDDEPRHAPINLDDFAAVLVRLPSAVRGYLASALLDSLTDEDEESETAVYDEAHRRFLELSRGEADTFDADEVVAGLRMRDRDAEAESAWAEEAHRRWEAFQRGEEEMPDFDDAMIQIRANVRRAGESTPPPDRIESS